MEPVAASTAYLLISHGSRDPRPQEAMNHLAELVRQRLSKPSQAEFEGGESDSLRNGRSQLSSLHATESLHVPAAYEAAQGGSTVASLLSSNQKTWILSRPQTNLHKARKPFPERVPQAADSIVSGAGVIVGTACLELSVLPLREQIYEFGCRLIAAGIGELKLLPVFLMAGVHVMEDIPAEVEAARQRLGNDIKLTVCEHLGSHPSLLTVLEKRLASVPAESAILVAHGSRRLKGNKGVEKLARLLNTQVAYWAVPPDIETQVIELMQQGCQKLTILPYFLFAGGITDAIAHRTEELAERFPKVQFRLLPTLGATAEIAKISAKIIQSV